MIIFIILIYLIILVLCGIMLRKLKQIKTKSDIYEYKLKTIDNYYKEYTQGRNAFTVLRDIKNIYDEVDRHVKEEKDRT